MSEGCFSFVFTHLVFLQTAKYHPQCRFKKIKSLENDKFSISTVQYLSK